MPRKIIYNLKIWVGVVVSIIVFAPFVILRVMSRGDILEYESRGYYGLEFLLMSAIGFAFFLSLATSRRFAEFCARDAARVSQTVATARSCAVLCGLALGAAMILYCIS